MNQIEHKIQTEVATWIRCEHPRILWTASAGGMRTGIHTARKMKAMGYRKGCPDLLIFEPRGGYLGLFIELKAPGGTKQPQQREFLQEANDRGYMAVFCEGYKETVDFIGKYLKLSGCSAMSAD